MAKLPKTDVAKSSKGIWVDYEGGIRFRIARAGNVAYQAKLRELLADNLPSLRHRKGQQFSDQELEAHLRAAAECVLVDWDGIEGDDGAVLPYSVDAAYAILSSDETQEVAAFVWGVASDAAAYRKSSVEAALGNS